MLFRSSKEIDIAFKLKLETFKDKYMCKLQLEDVKNSIENSKFEDDYLELNGKDISFPIETVVYPKRLDIEEPLNLIFNDYSVDDFVSSPKTLALFIKRCSDFAVSSLSLRMMDLTYSTRNSW